jgi:hypothetical protein
VGPKYNLCGIYVTTTGIAGGLAMFLAIVGVNKILGRRARPAAAPAAELPPLQASPPPRRRRRPQNGTPPPPPPPHFVDDVVDAFHEGYEMGEEVATSCRIM